MTPATPHPPAEHDALMARLDEALSRKPRLADNLARTASPANVPAVHRVTVTAGTFAGRGVCVVEGGACLSFHVCANGRVALHVTSAASRDGAAPGVAASHLATLDSPYSRWFGEPPEHLGRRDGRDCDDDLRYEARSGLDRNMSRAFLSGTRSRFESPCGEAVAAIEAAEDGDWLADPSGRVDAAWRAWELSRVVRHLARDAPGGAGPLIAAVMRGRPTLALDDLVAIGRAAQVTRPDYVAQALQVASFLWRLLDADLSLWRCARPHLRSLSEGRAPLAVVADMLADRTNVRVPFADLPGVVVRSLANSVAEPERMRDVGDLVVSFMSSRPSQAALATDEMAAVDDMSRRLSMAAGEGGTTRGGARFPIHALMDATGRMRHAPANLHDAMGSLRRSIAEIAALRRSRTDEATLDRVWLATAFPERRRHEQLARIDAEWHERANGRLDELQGLRDAIAARIAVRREGERRAADFPHPSEGPVRVHDVVLTPLRSEGDYVREGREMRHCLGTLAESGRIGRLVAYSAADATHALGDVPTHDRTGMAHARAEDVAKRSTAGLDVMPDGTLRLRQHLGIRNGPAPRHHLEAMRELASRLNSARFGTEALARARDRARPSDRDRAPGPDDLLPTERDRLMELLFVDVRLWLPPSQAQMDPVTWCEAAISGTLPTSARS